MIQPQFEVADIINRNRDHIIQISRNPWKARTLFAIGACRTSSMGYHIDQCNNPQCGEIHISYNSCRNRHCPKCQGHKREEWIRAREADLLNVPYYHVVFTLPREFNRLCLLKPAMTYNLLFKTAWSVIKDFAQNPKFLGAKSGMIAILHTWGQNLSLHPHLHCIVPGGGATTSNRWIHAKGKGKYLFPVKAMGKVFRARFVDGVRKIDPGTSIDFKKLFSIHWVVYCKRPFFGPSQVVEYLGRYTHKIAISNHRIVNTENDSVTFLAKNYRQNGKKYPVTLTDHEFIRRFSMHILPRGFTRIRHYGILSCCLKNTVLPLLRDVLGETMLPERPPLRHRICCICNTGRLVTIVVVRLRGPPLFNLSNKYNTVKNES